MVVNQVFQNYTDYMGITVMVAVLCYSIQLYADFSGGIDVVLGTAELFGITLDETLSARFSQFPLRIFGIDGILRSEHG